MAQQKIGLIKKQVRFFYNKFTKSIEKNVNIRYNLIVQNQMKGYLRHE